MKTYNSHFEFVMEYHTARFVLRHNLIATSNVRQKENAAECR